MKQYSTFIFDHYELNEHENQVHLHYTLDDEMHFEEILTLPADVFQTTEDVNEALFALHLVAGISYYKTCCPKEIEIRSGELSKSQAEFWNTLYTKGLGEFFYKNEIDFRGLIHFPFSEEKEEKPSNTKVDIQSPTNVLVPIGGGKDSIVSIELLKKAGIASTLFRIGGHPLIQTQAGIAGLPLLTIERKLPKTLFEINEQGALNGHVPITAFNSFAAVLTAVLGGFDGIVFSNERSANEGNTELYGQSINHQWSKSFEFEQMMQEYISKHITTSISYFSLLRPLSELHICKIFSQYDQYLRSVTSCNANWRILKEKPLELWGLDSKSAFVFALYAAYLPKDTVVQIFGANLYEEESILSTYKQLLGTEGIKPFECVGTPEETKAAMLLAHQKGDYQDSVAMQYFQNEVLPSIKNHEELLHNVLSPIDEHNVPTDLYSLLLGE